MSSKALVLATAIDGDDSTSTIVQGRKPLGEITLTGLRLHDPENVPYEDYLEMGKLFGIANRQIQWVVGDWLNLVRDIYPDRYSQAMEVTGLAKQTLINRASICDRIPYERRRDGLHFSVHAEVAYLPPKEREKWLNLAWKNDWDRDTLREHRRAARELESGPVGDSAVSSSAATNGELEPGPRTCPTCGQEIEE